MKSDTDNTKSQSNKLANTLFKNSFNSTITVKDMKEWPGAFGIYKISKAAMMRNFKTFIGLAIIFGVFYLLEFIIPVTAVHHEVAYLIERFIFELIYIFLSTVIISATIRSVEGEEVSIGSVFPAVFDKTRNILLTGIFVGILSIASILLLIIPAFFIIPRIYLSLYFVVDQNMNPIEAIKASWDATEGHVGKVYGILGVNILILLPIITLIGVLATVYFGFMYYAATAVLYVYLTKNKKQKLL